MSSYSQEFLTFLKEQENGAFLRGQSPALHDSPEGGNPTVGFGHKMTDEEVRTGKVYGYDVDTMTVEQAEEVMLKDLKKHEASLKRELGDDFNKLDQTRKEMLLDFQYNLGSAKDVFPSFTEAVINNDLETMRTEYKRYFTDSSGDTKELESRNKAFSELFLGGEPEEAVQPQQTGERSYVIQPGDNLTQISAREGVAMEDIMRANGILDRNAIQAGQELIIPGSDEVGAVEQEEEDPLAKVLEEAYDYGKSKIIGLFK